MDLTLIAYWICFLTGTAYAAVSALLTGFFGAIGGHDISGAGGHDVGHAGGDYGAHAGDAGHGEAYSAGGEAETVLAPLSPATISVFMATFGGVGIILTTMFKMNLFMSLPISAASGFVVSAAVVSLFYHLFTKVQASSETRMAEIIGLTAEVTVPIPKDGVGEIAYVCRGARLVSSARARNGREVPRHETVRIIEQVGTTLYVEPHQGSRAEPARPADDQPIRD